MFKRKTWTEVRRVFTPPCDRAIKGTSNDMAMKFAFGFTSVELRCDQTGEVKFIQEYGDQTKV